MPITPLEHHHVAVGGDFASVFDLDDYLAMVNALDEATAVLRAHLILEEFLNIWASRTTGTEDLFDGVFVPFKTKLSICKNLGFSIQFLEVFDRINTIRNRFSHRRKYKLDESLLSGLKTCVNALPTSKKLLPCEEFEIFLAGTTHDGSRTEVSYTWLTADSIKRIAIIQVILVLKLVEWIQQAFNDKGIKYDLVVWGKNNGIQKS